MVEHISQKFIGPIPGRSKAADIPLNPQQENFPKVKYWQPELWNALRRGANSQDLDSTVFSAFMEDQFGRPIQEATRSNLCQDFGGFFTQLFNMDKMPNSFVRTDLTTRERHRIATEGRFPWLRLCDGHWKYQQTWTHALSGWKKHQLPKLLEMPYPDADVIEVMTSLDDCAPKRGKAREVIKVATESESSSAGSKRGRVDESTIESFKKPKAAVQTKPFHPAKPKARGKQPMRFAQVDPLYKHFFHLLDDFTNYKLQARPK